MKAPKGTCELCERKDVIRTVHHLTPKEEGGTLLPTAMICIPCHKQIHAMYSNKELALRLHTIERLKEDEKLKKYLKWIKKQPSTVQVRTRKSNELRNRR